MPQLGLDVGGNFNLGVLRRFSSLEIDEHVM